MTALRELGEREALERLRALCLPGEGVVVGPGDDAAVLAPAAGHDLIATTDAFVAGVHWEAAWMSPAQVGARLAAANLSDLAAMAAQPRWGLASYGLGEEVEWEWLEACQRGLVSTLAEFGAALVGGNLTRVTGDPWISVTLLGDSMAGASWRREGATPGDVLAVTGVPGRAGAATRLIRARGNVVRQFPRLLECWRAPEPRVNEARALWRVGAVRAAIDVSDGLSGDLFNLCRASGVGATIEEALLPQDLELERAARELAVEPHALLLGPSDDYELLLAIDPERWAHAAEAAQMVGCTLTRIGNVRPREEGITFREVIGTRRPLEPTGWDHFAAPR